MPLRHRELAFVRRQREAGPSTAWQQDATDCINDGIYQDEWCDLPDCRCTADDAEWMWEWLLVDCGREIAEWWRSGLIAECPLAFVRDRGSTTATQRATPRPVPVPAPQSTSRPAVISPVTSVSSVRAPVVAITTTRTLAVPSSDAVLSPAEDLSPALDSVTLVDGQSLDSASDSQEVSATLPDITPLEEALSSADVAASQLAQPASDRGGDGDWSADKAVGSEASSLEPEQTFSSAGSGGDVSSGVPVLGPLNPSSPGQGNKLGAGVIAGIMVGVLAVIAIFLAFWYRSHRRSQRANPHFDQFSDSIPTSHNEGGSSGLEAWTQFGGAKGSIIPSNKGENSEKDAPINNMFPRQDVPPSAKMSPMFRGQSFTSADQANPQVFSAEANHSGGRRLLSDMTQRWRDCLPSFPPPYVKSNGSDSLEMAHNRLPATASFAQLSSDSADFTPIQIDNPGSRLHHPYPNAAPPIDQGLYLLSEQEDIRHSENLDAGTQAMSDPSGLIIRSSSEEDLREFSAEAVHEDHQGAYSTPNIRWTLDWTRTSLPGDISALNEPEEIPDMRAASTRGSSLDLAWVTERDWRKPVSSWALPSIQKSRSMKSKRSSRSTRIRSGHSVISRLSDSSKGPSKSTRSSSSRRSRSAAAPVSPTPDMPSFSSVPSFKLGLGTDGARCQYI